ncbi:hypothetical protein G7Y89_g6638 [Cudoniella acicularis]|uniref:Uncharacterized protein n=1 Tax=Cudoniella acicularis TaxID=354080 RepID=A0A8H4RNH4_9HELO|nr:hypothetical protein G7Y89_g6638 [Cudoniella acicularis]
MAPVQKNLLAAIDLGTGSQAAAYALVEDSRSADGSLRREKPQRSPRQVGTWPGSYDGGKNLGDYCLPSVQVWLKSTRQLLFWGFAAQAYLNLHFPDPPLEDVYIVDHPKLLLLDHDRIGVRTVNSEQFRAEREELEAVLGKSPREVFEEGLKPVVKHVMESARDDYAQYYESLNSCKVELVLAFPAGWPDYIHTMVAGCGARAMGHAISSLGLENVVFGIEDVYTVSETMCGVKEWLRDIVGEVAVSLDLVSNPPPEFGSAQCADIGAGTGCLTLFKLVSRSPLRVDQLGPTHCEAVKAEFKRQITPILMSADYLDDIPSVINKICRLFNEKKKECGTPLSPHSSIWNVPVDGLRPDPSKNFLAGRWRIEREKLDACYDPPLDKLESKIGELLDEFPETKAIVFLGQLGSSSRYLKNRLLKSTISSRVNIRYSKSGKMDVVKGALSERLYLSEQFLRRFKTLKSYGTLITLPYWEDPVKCVAYAMFPDALAHGAIPFERDMECDKRSGDRVTVIEWAISKGTTLENTRSYNVDQNGERNHIWKANEKIEFKDIIIVSDEIPPPVQFEGKSHTLWTHAHERNELTIAGQKMEVQQIPFSWNLTMSQRTDAFGQLVGCYEKDDLRDVWWPEVVVKKHRRTKHKRLDYDLLWDITEMQVKVHVRALIPNAIGPRTTQLAEQRELSRGERVYVTESRSAALQNDISISSSVASAAGPRLGREARQARNESQSQLPGPSEAYNPGGDEIRQGGQQPRRSRPEASHAESMQPQVKQKTLASSRPDVPKFASEQGEASSSTKLRLDGRRREGCFTCKARKKKCDCVLTLNEASDPPWAKAPSQLSENLVDWKQQISRKRKSSESNSSRTVSRDRSMTLAPLESSSSESQNMQSMFPTMGSPTTQNIVSSSRPRGIFTARRGGGNAWKDSKGAGSGLGHAM